MKHHIPFSLYSVDILVLPLVNTLSLAFSGINKNNFFLFVFVFTALKKKIFIFLSIFRNDLILF